MTPLHYATERGHIKLCQLLIDHGANVDTVDKVRPVKSINHKKYDI